MLTSESGGSDVVGKVSAIGGFPRKITNENVASLTAGKEYKIQFSHRIVGGDGDVGIVIEFWQDGERGTMKGVYPTDDWQTETIYFTAIATAALEMRFRFAPIISDLRIDEISIYEYKPYWERYYELPGASTGAYYVTIDGSPVWQGEEDEGWFEESGTRRIFFDINKVVSGGSSNLVVYYFTVESPENAVARLLFKAGLYANEAAALAAMDYTATGVTIDRISFKAGSKCLNAIKKLCERCDYRFYFKYDGTPVFKPKPAPGATSFTFTAQKHIASVRTYQDRNEIRNRIVITGERQAEPISRDETMPSKLRGEDSDATSISDYGERTLTIDNHLFQTQAAIDAMKATLLAEYKDPKWYADLEMPFNPVPLELGDKMSWKERLSPVLEITETGIIRDIKINNFNTTYRCVT